MAGNGNKSDLLWIGQGSMSGINIDSWETKITISGINHGILNKLLPYLKMFN
jgi:hypothetical protein